MSFDGIHLQIDGIKEALFEIRFETPVVPEAVIGRLTDASEWAEFNTVRLGSADIPHQFRAADANLRFTPSYELTRMATNEMVRIGPNSLSYHRLPPYPGWSVHMPAIAQAIDVLFSQIKAVVPVRLGFRYLNALNHEQHHITGPADLALTVETGDGFVPQSFALNYRHQESESHVRQVQVATPDYVQSNDGTDFSVLIDIDIFSPDGYQFGSGAEVMSWVEKAHILLKDDFFSLLPGDVIKKLTAE